MGAEIDRCEVPSGDVVFDFGGGPAFTADAVELERDLRRLAQETKAKQGDHYQYLDEIIKHVQDKYNVALKLGQADALTIKISEALTRKKKALLTDLNAMLGLPGTTTSTASPAEE